MPSLAVLAKVKTSRALEYTFPNPTSTVSWYGFCMATLNIASKKDTSLLLEIHRALFAIRNVQDIILGSALICVICKVGANQEAIHQDVSALIDTYFSFTTSPLTKE